MALTVRSRSAALAGLLAALAGCAAPPVPVHHDSLMETYYTRYVMHGDPEGAYVRTHPSTVLSYTRKFAPGSEVDIRMYSAERIDMTVDGIPVRMFPLDQPFATTPEGVEAFLAKHFVTSPDDVDYSGIRDTLLDTVREGIAPIGAGKQAVFVALGYPRRIDEDVYTVGLPPDRIMRSNQWVYLHQYVVFPFWRVYQFDADGKLIDVQ